MKYVDTDSLLPQKKKIKKKKITPYQWNAIIKSGKSFDYVENHFYVQK